MRTETDHATVATEPPAESDLDAAGSQLSTAPRETGQAVLGAFGGARRAGTLGALAWTGREAWGWCRWFWRQLTSMRVALMLLFLLSLGSIPGSLVPQNSVDLTAVQDFKTRHPGLTPLYERLQLFDVYSSVWFSAIYLLLFISLVGCIVPRGWQFIGQLRSRPPAAPRRLTRLPAYTTWRTSAEPEEVLTAAQALLARRRFRAHTVGDAVAAEKGQLREAGNLAFHIALIVLLVAFAVGQLWKTEGGKLIVKGGGFANTLTQYDDFRSGAFFDTADLDSFGFTLEDFHATFERSGPQRGTAREYRADVTYWKGADGAPRRESIEVNHPLRVDGSTVYLIGQGYAPVVTVRDGQGDLAFKGPVPFLPQDGNLTSSGVVKVTDYRGPDGRKDQLGFQGFFVPTYGGANSGTMFSQFPALDFPVLFLTAYRGDLGLDAGLPQNVYQLDSSKLKQFKKENGDPFAKMMRPGEEMTLPHGAGTLTFDGVERWASFQISSQPGNGWALGGALTAVLGLAGSLLIQRRRVWVRAVRVEDGGDGRTRVEMAGLGRSESAKIPEELGELALALRRDAPVAVANEPARTSANEPAPTDDPTDPDSGEGAGT